MLQHLLTIEDSINHMTAKQSHLYLISQMRINFLVLMN